MTLRFTAVSWKAREWCECSLDSVLVGASESARIAGDPGGEPQVVDFDHIFLVDSGRHTQPRTMCILHAGLCHVVAQLAGHPPILSWSDGVHPNTDNAEGYDSLLVQLAHP